jgi:hypothetical protein|tara:strand:+ start:951 stop:1457 length:507 start_codon:yes stop_codon:yes gene_type:complete
MSNIVQISDFKGQYYVAVNSSASAHFQSIIDSSESDYLTNLMGTDLKALFIANLVSGVPTDVNYLKFYNPYSELYLGENLHSKGLKEVLIGLVYNDYLQRDNYTHSLTGVISNQNENSNVLTAQETSRFAESRRNNIVESYNMIGRKIKELELYIYSDVIEMTFLDLF